MDSYVKVSKPIYIDKTGKTMVRIYANGQVKLKQIAWHKSQNKRSKYPYIRKSDISKINRLIIKLEDEAKTSIALNKNKIDPSKTTFKQAFDQFYRHIEKEVIRKDYDRLQRVYPQNDLGTFSEYEKNIKNGTYKIKQLSIYNQALKPLLSFLGDIKLLDFGQKEIDNIAESWNHLFPTTKMTYYSKLKAVFRFCLESELPEFSAFNKMPRLQSVQIPQSVRTPIAYSDKDIEIIIHEATTGEKLNQTKKHELDRMISDQKTLVLSILYAFGARGMEVCRLSIDPDSDHYADFENRQIIISNAINKKKKGRVLPMNDNFYNLFMERKKLGILTPHKNSPVSVNRSLIAPYPLQANPPHAARKAIHYYKSLIKRCLLYPDFWVDSQGNRKSIDPPNHNKVTIFSMRILRRYVSNELLKGSSSKLFKNDIPFQQQIQLLGHAAHMNIYKYTGDTLDTIQMNDF